MKGNIVKNELRGFICEILLTFRGIIRKILGFFILIGIISICVAYSSDDGDYLKASLIITIVAFVLRYAYDRIIAIIKPEDMDIWLEK